MPIKRHIIEEEEIVTLINQQWHQRIDVGVDECDATNYHPITEINNCLKLVPKLSMITYDNKKLTKKLMMFGLYMIYNSLYRREALLWYQHRHDTDMNAIRIDFIDDKLFLMQIIKDLIKMHHSKYQHQKAQKFNQLISNLIEYYKQMSQSEYLNRQKFMKNMFRGGIIGVDDCTWSDKFYLIKYETQNGEAYAKCLDALDMELFKETNPNTITKTAL